MKHISKYIFGVLMFIGFINGVSAEVTPVYTEQCTYSFDGVTVMATQGENGDVSIRNSGTPNVPQGYKLNQSGYISKLKSKDFMINGSFGCPILYVRTEKQETDAVSGEKNYKFDFQADDPGCKDGWWGKSSCERNVVAASSTKAISACKYSFSSQGETFSFTVKLKSSNGIFSKNTGNIQITDQKSSNKYKVDYSDVRSGVDRFIDSNGNVTCPYINLLTCADTNSNGDTKTGKAFWTFSGDKEKKCGASTNKETKTDDPDYNKTNGGSHFTSTDGKTVEFLKKIYNLLKILVPLAIIIFSIVDFLKVLFLSDDKNYKEAYAKLIRRVLIGILIFLVPVLISFVIQLAGMGDNGILTIFE